MNRQRAVRGDTCRRTKETFMFQRARIPLLFLPASVLGCSVGDLPTLGGDEQPMYSDLAGVGPFNGVEWQIDAPWRLEPTVGPDGAMTYDPIPLVITINDAADQIDQVVTPGNDIRPFRRFCGLYVIDMPNGGAYSVRTYAPPDLPAPYIPAEEFYEIEGEERWLGPAHDPGPDHQIRRLWDPDDETPLEPILDIRNWSGWNAVAMYTPVSPRSPGENRGIIAVARISEGTACGTNPTMTANEIMAQMHVGRVSEITQPGHIGSYFFGEFLSVHYGDAPLPRFDDGQWVYGDIHYHSQGTDNINESGVGYRGTIQAMKAMGLDYAFATEHASNSQQISGVRRFGLDDLPGVWWIPDVLEDWLKNKLIDYLNDNGYWAGMMEIDSLRDMSAPRFKHFYHWLNDDDGANAEVGASGGSDRRPQIFLAGEVDVIPETASPLGFNYGLGQFYSVSSPCFAVPDFIIDYTNFEEMCQQALAVEGPYHYDIKDIQGLVTLGKSRQHLVYLPHGTNEDDFNADEAFIGSDTNTYGGGTKWLPGVLGELQDQHGYMFLAHPVDHETSKGVDRLLGPDMVPFSDVQLQEAFESPEVLGLEIWNSSTWGRTHDGDENASGDHSFPFLAHQGHANNDDGLPDYHQMIYPLDWNWNSYDGEPMREALLQGSAMWDHVLLWGINPDRLADAGLPTDTPRKMFVAGGSDAHGDLNYHRGGGVLGWSSASDNALGKVRNLVYMGEGSGRPSQDEVREAMKTGNFSVTDGPAVRIAIDTNGNGVIDANDKLMGSDDFDIAPDSKVPLLVEWKSTPEFGPLDTIYLYLGVQAGDYEGLVYSVGGTCTVLEGKPFSVAGHEYCPTGNNHVRDNTGTLYLNPPEDLTGTMQVMIDPKDFPLFTTSCETHVEPDPEMGDRVIEICTPENVQLPSRLYVRARAETVRAPQHEVRRRAMTNPIWMKAKYVASPPTVSVNFISCDEDSLTNTFQVVVEQGPVTGNLTRQVRVGSSLFYMFLFGDTVTASSGEAVTARARACNENGCSPYVYDTTYGPVCQPPPPNPPTVKLEYAYCKYGTNTFFPMVVANGTGTDWFVKQYKITSSGVWKTLSSPKITASGGQRVYLRAKACNDYGCSSYRSTSMAGPACSGTIIVNPK